MGDSKMSQTRPSAPLKSTAAPVDSKNEPTLIIDDSKSDNDIVKDIIVRDLMGRMDSELKAFEALDVKWLDLKAKIKAQEKIMNALLDTDKPGAGSESKIKDAIASIADYTNAQDVIFKKGMMHFAEVKKAFVEMVRMTCEKDNDSVSRVSVNDLKAVAAKIKKYFDEKISPTDVRTNRDVISEEEIKSMFNALIKIFTLLKNNKEISREETRKYEIEFQRYTRAYKNDFEAPKQESPSGSKDTRYNKPTAAFIKQQIEAISVSVDNLENMNAGYSDSEKRSDPSYKSAFINEFSQIADSFRLLGRIISSPDLNAEAIAVQLARIFNERLQNLLIVSGVGYVKNQIQSIFIDLIKIQFHGRNYKAVFQYIEDYKGHQFGNEEPLNELNRYLLAQSETAPWDVRAKIMTSVYPQAKKISDEGKPSPDRMQCEAFAARLKAMHLRELPQMQNVLDQKSDNLLLNVALKLGQAEQSQSKEQFEEFEQDLLTFLKNSTASQDRSLALRRELPQARAIMLAHLGATSQAADIILEHFAPEQQATAENRAILTKAGVLDEKSDKPFAAQIANGVASLKTRQRNWESLCNSPSLGFFCVTDTFNPYEGDATDKSKQKLKEGIVWDPVSQKIHRPG